MPRVGCASFVLRLRIGCASDARRMRMVAHRLCIGCASVAHRMRAGCAQAARRLRAARRLVTAAFSYCVAAGALLEAARARERASASFQLTLPARSASRSGCLSAFPAQRPTLRGAKASSTRPSGARVAVPVSVVRVRSARVVAARPIANIWLGTVERGRARRHSVERAGGRAQMAEVSCCALR